MKTVIYPTTVPHIVHCDGRGKFCVWGSNGKAEYISPLGMWFSCKANIDNDEYIIVFDNVNILMVSTKNDRIFNLLKKHARIGTSVIGYKKCFEDFNNTLFEFNYETT